MRKKVAAAALGIAVLFAFFWAENNISRSYYKCVQAETDYQSANNPNKYRFIVGRVIRRQIVCTGRFADRHNGFIAALAAIAVAGFTATLWWSTRGLWRETSAHARHLENTVAIGKAQVRAYVSITKCNLRMMELAPSVIVPVVTCVATNNGQSPARDFVWNVTLEYTCGTFKRRRMLTGRFGNQPGIDIPVGRDTQDMNAIVADMTAKQIIVPPSMSEDMVLAGIKIDFRYRDVFEDIWIDDAYFTALMKKIGTTWVIGENNISAMPRPNDWSDGNYDSQEEA